ncbi:hypothetical protein DUNSADRAFT_8743 [Dunaliella salina]|uniref:Encoded protein n=1 Tax=Dunaliella salina TaxID=3046 RepID=A0ABQ7GIU8_DUNSA|nr:hypothetical protein DUNSADRAFT_8743 [Dunaliella salina]|eukprot:KAF5834535.1 hypothetical protein DUNSADRAFT_8743 [Dunaliella salina]
MFKPPSQAFALAYSVPPLHSPALDVTAANAPMQLTCPNRHAEIWRWLTSASAALACFGCKFCQSIRATHMFKPPRQASALAYSVPLLHWSPCLVGTPSQPDSAPACPPLS